jgi:uncharacterized RDD family membrane protein YckC
MHAAGGFTGPEAAGSGGQDVAASLEGGAGSSRPKFVVERNDVAADEGLPGDGGQSRDAAMRARETRSSGGEGAKREETSADGGRESRSGESFLPQEARSAQVQPNLLPEEDASSWRREVSEKLHRYHARRRPRAPRYPSLRLKFETPEAHWATPVREASASSQPAQMLPMQSVTRHAVAMDYVEVAPATEAAPFETGASEVAVPVAEPKVHEGTGKIIEFPRTMYAPPARVHELADPVLDGPRILEAPEVVPPPPALGGMTIEETAKAEPERRAGIDMPLQSAPLGQRLLAVALDASIVLAAAGLFGGIFYKITKATPTPQMAALGAGLLGIFWAAYQYLLMVHTGTTPGLRALKLRVQRFDGTPARRRLRRWRVLGSVLSGVSLGMGYAWHFLDEDGLCWHERVTKTHIASEKQP